MASKQPQSSVHSPHICHDDPMTQSELEKLVDIQPDDAKYHVYKTLEKKLLFIEMNCEPEGTPGLQRAQTTFL